AEVTSSIVDVPDFADPDFDDAPAYRRAACICEFLANRIIRGSLGKSEGFITLTDAEILTGIDKGQLSTLCNENKIESNGQIGTARRLLLQSLIEYVKEKRKRRPSDKRGPKGDYFRNNCGTTYLPTVCPKCRSGDVDPLGSIWRGAGCRTPAILPSRVRLTFIAACT